VRGGALAEILIMRRETSYAPADLVKVFDRVWRVIAPRQRVKPGRKRQLRLDLAKVIIGLAAGGVHDPRELRRRAIEHMLLSTE
jgi:hypothetical protein